MKENEKQNEFMELLEPVMGNLSRFARALTRNVDEARDLVGETVLRAYENFDKIRHNEAFLSYLFTIATRHHRRLRRRSSLFGEYDSEKANLLKSMDASPETKVDVKLLYRAIKSLPAKQGEAVVLFEISGFSIEEIKEIQGGTISGVKSRLKRGREKLADMLNADYRGFPEQQDKPRNGESKENEIISSYNHIELLKLKEY